MTCRAIAENLRGKILDETAGKFLEEIALNAVYKSLSANFSIADIKLLFSELPKILSLNYPAVENIRDMLLQITAQFMRTVSIKK